MPRRIGGLDNLLVRQSSHFAVVPLQEPDFAAAHAKAPPVRLLLPKEHATLFVPRDDGEFQPHAPTMQGLQQVTEM